jgi:hypothetical protein
MTRQRVPRSTPKLVFVSFLAAFSVMGTAVAAPNDDAGFVTLFDGDDLDGWQLEENDVWYFHEEFRNFILVVKFKQKALDSTSRVLVRVADPQAASAAPRQMGGVVAIGNDDSSHMTTGSLKGVQQAESARLKPPGEWNVLEITCIANHCTMCLNGRLVNSVETQLRPQGRLGVKYLAVKDDISPPVQFGAIRVKHLPDDARGYHVLFDGTQLDGWKVMTRAGRFALNKEEGVIIAKGRGLGLLWHRQMFGNFILLLDWKVSQDSDNSGVLIRFPDPTDDPWIVVRRGYEIQIHDTGRPGRRTGSVMRFQDSTSIPTHPVGDWNHYEIRAIGQQYTVWINGQIVTQFQGDRETKGHIGLQNDRSRSRVSFRNIRVVELAD